MCRFRFLSHYWGLAEPDFKLEIGDSLCRWTYFYKECLMWSELDIFMIMFNISFALDLFWLIGWPNWGQRLACISIGSNLDCWFSSRVKYPFQLISHQLFYHSWNPISKQKDTYFFVFMPGFFILIGNFSWFSHSFLSLPKEFGIFSS